MPARRELTLTTGEKKQYDKILIATGANAVNLPVGDIPADRIFTMRTVHDAERLKEALDQRPHPFRAGSGRFHGRYQNH